MVPIIAIDGPSGAGKGTLCRMVANETGFSLLDSGAIYRLTALACINAGVDMDNERDVLAVAHALDIRFDVQSDTTGVYLNSEEVSKDIRVERVGMAASLIAVYAQVRAALLQRQRDFAVSPGLVADGRDMGTVVFPEADVKVFLTATAQERALRRIKQLELSGIKNINNEQILKDIVDRDERDSSRSSAPLVAADDALVLDSTHLSVDQVCDIVLKHIRRSLSFG